MRYQGVAYVGGSGGGIDCTSASRFLKEIGAIAAVGYSRPSELYVNNRYSRCHTQERPPL